MEPRANLWDAIVSEWVFVVTTIGGGFVMLLRKVFTNEKQIDLMRQTLTTHATKLEQQHQDAVESRKELKQAIEKQRDATDELVRYLRDNK